MTFFLGDLLPGVGLVPALQGLRRWELLPGGRIFLCFGLSPLLSWFCPFGLDGLCAKGKPHGREDAALAGGAHRRLPLLTKKPWRFFPLGYSWLFPLKRQNLLRPFPVAEESWEKQPRRLKKPKGAGRSGCGFAGPRLRRAQRGGRGEPHSRGTQSGRLRPAAAGLSLGNPQMSRAWHFPSAFNNAVQEGLELPDESCCFSLPPCRPQGRSLQS